MVNLISGRKVMEKFLKDSLVSCGRELHGPDVSLNASWSWKKSSRVCRVLSSCPGKKGSVFSKGTEHHRALHSTCTWPLYTKSSC